MAKYKAEHLFEILSLIKRSNSINSNPDTQYVNYEFLHFSDNYIAIEFNIGKRESVVLTYFNDENVDYSSHDRNELWKIKIYLQKLEEEIAEKGRKAMIVKSAREKLTPEELQLLLETARI